MLKIGDKVISKFGYHSFNITSGEMCVVTQISNFKSFIKINNENFWLLANDFIFLKDVRKEKIEKLNKLYNVK